MATRESMSSDEFGAKLCKAYDEYEEHREAGRLDDDAPGAHEIVNQLMRANREAREAREAAATGGVAGKEIEKDGVPDINQGEDDEQAAKTANGNSGGGGPMPARDSKPRWGRPHPLERAVKGYGRLG